MEKPQSLDLTPRNLFLTAKEVGNFVLARMRGGAYSELVDLGSQLDSEINQSINSEQ